MYRILLCSFAPPPTEISFTGDLLVPVRAEHAIETSILRTSKGIYHEAYDVMVKTNRFVKITSEKGLPVKPALCGQMLPMVTDKKDVVERFKGYALHVHLGFKNPSRAKSRNESWYNPVSAMILHRELGKFCLGVNDGDAHSPGFSESLKISITMAPVVDAARGNKLMPSFDDFFSQKMQETLFAPLKTHLYGRRAVEVKGHVDSSTATALHQQIAKEKYSDPSAVLAEFTAAKEEGSRLYRERKADDVCLKWADTAVEIDELLETNSWLKLVSQGKEDFVSQLAPVYFLMRLNIAHVHITKWAENTFVAESLAEDSLMCAIKSLKKDYWMKGYKYTPSRQHMAKLRFRYATFLRLQREPGSQDRALMFINGALDMQPGDAAILGEKENILEWMRQS